MGINLNIGSMASSLRRSSICVTANTPSEVLDAYVDDEEDFFGEYEDSHVASLAAFGDDEEELAVDGEAVIDCSEFNASCDSEDVVMLDSDSEKKLVEDMFRKGCGCGDNCYDQFSVNEVFLIRLSV